MSGENSGELVFLHLSDNQAVEEGEIKLDDNKTVKVLWKDVLVEGTYPMTPTANGAVDKPMHVIANGKSDVRTGTISMSDLVTAHDEGAFKYVTIPLKHRDDPMDNTGFVPRPAGVRVVEKERNGKQTKVFQAALAFTEPDVKGKVERGTIPDCSGGVFFNFLNKHTKKRYAAAMKHVALTPVPFMGNLDSFPPVFASDELNDGIPADTTVKFFEFDAGTPPDAGDNSNANQGDIVWNENKSLSWVRAQLEVALAPVTPPQDGRPFQEPASYWVEDVSVDDHALVHEHFKGERTTFVVPFERKTDAVVPAPSSRWIESRQAMIAASDDNFAEVSTDAIREKLGVALGDFSGDVKFSVGEITLDKRAKIRSEQGGEWVAAFSVRPDGGVILAPTTRWTKITEPTLEGGKQQSSSEPTVDIAASDDPLTARVRAARERRQAMLAGRN